MSASQRRKGHDWEREVARLFREQLGVDAKRGYQARGGGAEVADVVGLPGFHVECKVGARPNLLAAIAQAAREARAGEVPIAIVKRDRGEPVVVMRLADWLDLMARRQTAEQRVSDDNAVCICGCPPSEHESMGEDGECCESEDHQCLRVCVAVAELWQAAQARIRELETAKP